jgi:hypothetical protein
MTRATRVQFLAGTKSRFFLFATDLPPPLPPAFYPVGNGMDSDSLSLEVNQPGSEAHHSPLCNAEVKNAWSHTSAPPYVFMACCLIKHRILLHGMVFSYTQEQLYVIKNSSTSRWI